MKNNNTYKTRRKSFRIPAIFILTPLLFLLSCKTTTRDTAKTSDSKQKTGVLLVNHGSHSETWRQALLDLENHVKNRILSNSNIQGIKTAFMEYSEPSIATRLREFDAEGYTDIIIVPVFLTVSPHTFDDIPTIIGQKEDPQSKEMLKIENIECYTPKAKTYLAPNLDFTDILKKNVLRRVKKLSHNPTEEGLVLIGYGDETYDKEWSELFNKVAEYVKSEIGISEHTYGWCGHIAHYSPEKTTEAIHAALKRKQKAIVIPVLVAHDENFQIRIIGGGIEKVVDHDKKVIYKPDALLPDPDVEQWVVNIALEYEKKVQSLRKKL